MKVSRLAGSVAALMFALVGVASARQPDAPPPAAVLAEVEPALYAVRDADSTIYLFGTVHVRRPGSHWGGANARAALAEADEVWTELANAADMSAQAQALVAQYGIAPPDQPLSSLLTPEENRRLIAFTKRHNLPAAMFERMRPWLAAISLSMTPIMQSGYVADAGVDNMIIADAGASEKEMRAFETLEQQIGFLANLDADVQRQMVVDALGQSDMAPEQTEDLSTAWERGDTDTLERLVVEDMRERYPAVYEVLLVQRNNAWMDVLMQEMQGSGVDFIAVGAGHMLGADGLVEQFRARGFTVERVSPAE